MFIYIHIYVCMYVCMYVCVFMCLSVNKTQSCLPQFATGLHIWPDNFE